MNPNELTPTQRVETECKTTDWASGEPLVSKSFALELATELERVQKELKQQTSNATIFNEQCIKASIERDDLKRQVEELTSTNEVRANNLKEGCAVELEQEDTIYDLKRQIEELKLACDSAGREQIELSKDKDTLMNHCTLLRAENAELRKDKERLDWLDANYFSMWTSEDCDDDGNDIERVCLDVGNTDRNWITENSARQAINQAMKGGEK